ncbi:MAG: prepilin-type N-terminal cleavage/methylation domain-containing protein [Patescibacteria group bacterium]|nr:prepilin-type N-terminal cleavage/methylation domain-containing protein [Patescibacteria group bacterium]
MKLSSRKKGFTLIEIIVSFAVFTILMGVVIFGFQDTKKHEELRGASLQMVSNIKKVQNYAQTGHEFEDEVPAGGYGLHIDLSNQSQYLLFADKSSVSTATGCVDDAGNQRYDNEDGYSPSCIEDKIIGAGQVNFDQGVTINKIEVKEINKSEIILDTSHDFDLTFKNLKPFPFIGWLNQNINRDPGNENFNSEKIEYVNIYLSHEDLNKCRKIHIIGASGAVNEESSDCP